MVRLALICLGLSACSLGKNPGECATDDECRNAFGLGSVCAADGFCDVGEPNIRCTETAPPDVFQRPATYSNAVVIGSVFDMNTDQPQVRSAQLAVDQVNELGGLDGRKCVMISCGYQVDLAIDDLTEEEAALDVARYLTDILGANAIIGPSASDQCANVFPDMEARDVMVMSPSATSPMLTNIDGEGASDAAPGLFWRTVPPDDLQAQAMSWDLADRGITDLVIVHQESSYATALAENAQYHFGLAEGTATLFSFDNDSSRGGAITDAGVSGAEEVMFQSSDVNDIIAFLQAAALN
ncbi:MAG: ABC transporter substrate-binding protein, partial [Rhodobacterales bacterium]|nr:ABC transporter substrate-binding protein [Rhodobacterales bacterium]